MTLAIHDELIVVRQFAAALQHGPQRHSPSHHSVRVLREQIEEQPDTPRYLTTVRGFGYRFGPV